MLIPLIYILLLCFFIGNAQDNKVTRMSLFVSLIPFC